MDIIAIKHIRSGQVRPYADSVYAYEIETTPGDDTMAWDTFQNTPRLKKANHRKDAESHDGHCGFPFGLSSYGSLKDISSNGTKWRYTVTEPYCD